MFRQPAFSIPARLPQTIISALGHTSEHVAFSRSRLKTGPAAPLTLHFLVTLFEKTFAFAILAFHFPFARFLLHVLSKSDTDAYNQAGENAIRQIACSRLANFRFRTVSGLRIDSLRVVIRPPASSKSAAEFPK